MGTPITVLGTISLGTCGKPPIPASSSTCSTVQAGGRPVVVQGSYWGFHCSSDDCHIETASQGSARVRACGMSVLKQGSSLSFGDTSGVGVAQITVG